MFKRRVGAAVEFKRYLRRQRRKPATPAHLASGRPIAVRDRTGEGGWLVFSAPIVGPPYVSSKQIAGPFDTSDEANEWIAENHDPKP